MSGRDAPLEQLDLDAIFDRLWRAYAEITPLAARIHEKLAAKGESFRNDHIAVRTYDLDPIGLEQLARPFVDRGYLETGRYRFEGKRLRARSYSHPSGEHPRVFISELDHGAFPAPIRARIQSIVDEVDPQIAASPIRLLLEAPTWPPVAWSVYRELLEVSEYAAWVAAFGIRVNHFTVHANDLSSFANLDALNTYLLRSGERLNRPERPIQGDPGVGLEQSSTVADRVAWRFAEGERHEIPSCYYEFAWRHADASGELFDGFVTESADAIFESTDSRHHPSPAGVR